MQAVRFRSRPAIPRYRNRTSVMDKLTVLRQEAVHRALALAETQSNKAAAAAAGVPGIPAGPASVQPAGDTAARTTAPASSSDPSGAPAAAAVDVSSTSSSTSAASSTPWTPQWLRNLWGDTRRRRAPPPKPSPLTPAMATKGKLDALELEKKQQAEVDVGKAREAESADGWEILEHLKDYSVDDLKQALMNDPKSDDFEAPPRPRTPLRGPYVFFSPDSFDRQRVTWLRYEMMYSLTTALSPEDKLLIKLSPSIARDAQEMQRLADATGFPVDTVRDMVWSYHKKRREMQLLYKHRKEGNTLPPQEDTSRLKQEQRALQDKDDAERLRKVVAARDVSKCTLRQVEGFVLTKAHLRRRCPQTQLLYIDCCGRKKFKDVTPRTRRRLLHGM